MKTKIFLSGCFAFLCLLIYTPSFSQIEIDTAKLTRVVMKDGNEFYGYIYIQNETIVTLKTEILGNLDIPRNQIKLIENVQDALIVQGDVWLKNLQATRYFWAPNGYGLEKREGYYQNVWVLFNQASIGITKNFSIGAGTIPLFLFDGAPTPVFAVPKFSFQVIENKLNFGGGAIVGTILGGDEFFETGAFGILYGVGTVGNKDANATIGVGYGFAEGDFSNYPIITFGALKRIGKRSYFLTENYFISLDNAKIGLISLGGRTVWQRVSIDYGFVIPVSEDIGAFIAIPWLGFSVPFQY